MILRSLSITLAAIALTLPATAPAQRFSDSYTFLKAVRDGDGQKVTDILAEPGQSIINTRDPVSGDGALHIVTRRSDATYLTFLLYKGANPNLLDTRGNSPAMLAVENSFVEGITILGQYNANLNLGNASGETPLIRAVQMRNVEMVRVLIAAGADPDKTDSIAGMSARDYAKRDTRTPQILKMIEEAPKVKRADVSGPKL